MAEVLGEVQVGRYKHLLEQTLAMKGAIPTQTLSPELVPVLNLGNDRPEWSYLASERRCWGGGTCSAVAGETGHIQLINRNPEQLVVLDRMIIGSFSAAVAIHVGWRASILPGSATQLGSAAADTRYGIASLTTSAEVYEETNAASLITTIAYRTRLNSNVIHTVNGPWVLHCSGLAGENSIVVRCTTANLDVYCNFFWRERKLEPSER